MGLIPWLRRVFSKTNSIPSIPGEAAATKNSIAPLLANEAPTGLDDTRTTKSTLPPILIDAMEVGPSAPEVSRPELVAASLVPPEVCASQAEGGSDATTYPLAPRENIYLRSARSLPKAVDALVEELDGNLFFSKIAGVTKRNRRGPSRQKLIQELEEWTELFLCLEPENRISSHAIRIENADGEQLGYVPDSTAFQMAVDLAKGHLYRCFVAEITGWDHDHFGVNIALLHWDPIRAARPERDFERFVNKLAQSVDGYWFYARLIGLTKVNEDGNQRASLFAQLRYKQQLGIVADGETVASAKYVYLLDEYGARLGALELRQSRQVLGTFAEGRRWTAFFRDCTQEKPAPGFRPHVALLCLGAKASSNAERSVASNP